MRIIAGEYRGRKLKTLKGDDITRPTLDQVKEAVFNRLGQFFAGGTVLDLFAGSGALGLEALSRGCEVAYFVDQNYQAIQIIKANIAALNCSTATHVHKMNATKALDYFCAQGLKFDLIFLDPPYKMPGLNEILRKIEQEQLLNQGGKIVCETLKDWQADLSALNLVITSEAVYGITKISIFELR